MCVCGPRWWCVCVAAVVFLLPCAAFAACTVQPVLNVFPTDTDGSTAPPLHIAPTNPYFYPFVQASLTQRLSDLLVTDDGVAPNCFTAGNVFTFTYPMRVVLPAQLTAANFDVFDSASGVGLGISVGATAYDSGSDRTTVTVSVMRAGTPGSPVENSTGSGLRLKNVRVDASTTPWSYSFVRITAEATVPGTLNPTAVPVADPDRPYVVTGGEDLSEDDACGAGPVGERPGVGTQNGGGTLRCAASVGFMEQGFPVFLPAGASYPNFPAARPPTWGDLSEGATSLILVVSNVPAGVTVTFPATMSNNPATGSHAFVTFVRRGGGSCPGPYDCSVIYDPVQHSGVPGAGAAFYMTTGAIADGSPANGIPVIGVQISRVSAAGTAMIAAYYGPNGGSGVCPAMPESIAPQHDDINPPAVPRFVACSQYQGPYHASSRFILRQPFFTIEPPVTLSPASWSFGPQAVGAAGVPQTFIYANRSGADVRIGTISTGGAEFAVQPTSATACAPGRVVPSGASCTVTVALTAAASGLRAATLTITDSASGGPRSAALDGIGVLAPRLSPAALTFGPHNLGTVFGAQTVTYTNPGSTPVTLTGVDVTGDFILQSGTAACSAGMTVAPGGSCSLRVAFAPSTSGARSGSLIVYDSAVGSVRAAALGGDGTAANNPVPSLRALSPAGIVAGSGDTTVHVSGANFLAASVVRWNGAPLATTLVDAKTLAVVVPAADLRTAGTASLAVANPAPGGGASSAYPVVIAAADTDAPETAPQIIDSREALVLDSRSAPAAVLGPVCPGTSQSAARGVWVRYVPPTSGTVSVDVSGSDYQALVSLFVAGNSPGTFTQVSCGESLARKAGGRGEFVAPAIAYVADGAGDVWILVTAANGDGGRARIGVNFTASAPVPQADYTAMLPHVVSGGGYVTKLTLTNMARGANNVSVNFVDEQGRVVKSVTRWLRNPGETMRVATNEADRNGAITTQWANVSAQGRLAAHMLYEVGDAATQSVTNAVGFNDEAAAQSFVIPVEFQPNTRSGTITHAVGLALSNPTSAQVQVSLTLRDTGGNPVGAASVTLPPYGHTQRSLNADFAAVLPAGNFVGTVEGTSVQPVNVVAVGDDWGPFFATPPLSGTTRLVLPYMVNGASGGVLYRTFITLVNRSAAANTATVTYFDPQGTQLEQATYNLAANGVVRIVGASEVASYLGSVGKWAVVDCARACAANTAVEARDSGTYRYLNTVGYNQAPELVDFTLPVELEPWWLTESVGRSVGVPMANGNSVPATFTLQLLGQDGAVLATLTRTLNARSQLWLNLRQEFADVLPDEDFIGSLTVHSSVPIAALGLQQDDGPFLAVPVVSGRP